MKPFKFFQKRCTGIVWRTVMFDYIPLEEMGGEHISNIIGMLSRPNSPIPDPYLGRSHYEWYRIFCDELFKRTGQDIRLR